MRHQAGPDDGVAQPGGLRGAHRKGQAALERHLQQASCFIALRVIGQKSLALRAGIGRAWIWIAGL